MFITGRLVSAPLAGKADMLEVIILATAFAGVAVGSALLLADFHVGPRSMSFLATVGA